MSKGLKLLLIAIAVVSFGIALSYPILYRSQQQSVETTVQELSKMRESVLSAQQGPEDSAPSGEETAAPEAMPTVLAAYATPGLSVAEEAARRAGITVPPELFPYLSSEAEPESPPATVTVPDATLRAVSAAPAATPAPADALRPKARREQPLDRRETATPAPARREAAASKPSEAPAEAAQPPAAETEAPAGETAAPVARMTPPGPIVGTYAPLRAEPTAAPTLGPPTGLMLIIDYPCTSIPPTPTPSPTPKPTPTPTIDRYARTQPLSYQERTHVKLDVEKILPELRNIYLMNTDLVGWLKIPDMDVDYPVVQTWYSEFYLHHDFFGEENANGQIILETKCDPWTPSYNLVISGHNMNSGSMFGNLKKYTDKSWWEKHKTLEFDTLLARRGYVIFACFYSADYDEDEEGFRYIADIQYKIDADQWLAEIRKYQLYDTGIDARFGDEFVTLTTCNRSRRQDGRFVLVARKFREGEYFQ